MTVEELLVECLVALTYCENSRAPHRERIRITLDTADLSDNVREALTRLNGRLALHTSSNPWKFFESVGASMTFEREIRDLVADLNLPRYVYHGTIAGRLPRAYGKLPNSVLRRTLSCSRPCCSRAPSTTDQRA